MSDHEETRLALVLNGGVSLAVWMGGVTHELDVLRRASTQAIPTGTDTTVPTTSENEPAGETTADCLTLTADRDPCEQKEDTLSIWEEVLRHARTRVLVDVIAGTSAGGLNGAFLATAIGRGEKLASLRDVWKKSAALTPDALLGNPPPQSVLDGEFFARTICQVLHGPKDLKWSIRPEPVTLFTTATSLDGLPAVYTDGFGGTFDVSDHRRIYRFQYDPHAFIYCRPSNQEWVVRKRSVNHFERAKDSAGCQCGPDAQGPPERADTVALRQAARASAGFPVAFTPIDETPLLPYRILPDPDVPSPGSERASWITDGGVLNNAPFEPVLKAIADRRVERPVRRVLVYIVPSSGRSQEGSEARLPHADINWLNVLTTAEKYPKEANFRTGMSELSAGMRASSYSRQLTLFKQQLEESSADAGKIRQSAKSLFLEYRLRNIMAALWKEQQLRGEATGMSLLTPVPQQGQDGFLTISPTPAWVPHAGQGLRDLDGPENDSTDWSWGTSSAQRLIWLLVQDIEGRLLNIRRGVPEEDPEDDLRNALPKLSECAGKVRAVEARTHSELRNWNSDNPDQADLGPAARINSVFEKLHVRKAVGEQVQAALGAYCAAVSSAQPQKVRRACLVVEVLTRTFAPPSQPDYVSQFEFLRLGPDAHSAVYPLDNYAPLGDRKLYGVRLAHFGAFVDEAWRAHDFTWGRLDAAHHLLRLFIPCPETRRRTETRLHEAILRNEELDKGRMERNLTELIGDGRELFQRQLKRQGSSQARDTITAVLRLATDEGSPLHSPFREICRISFTHRPGGLTWLSPIRFLSLPGRLFWWRKVPKNPTRILRLSIWGLVINAFWFLAIAVGLGLALTVFSGWPRWETCLISFGALVVLVICEILFHPLRRRRRKRKDRLSRPDLT
ncbi:MULTISPECIES: DUF3376 domain-containing protein [unclassified Streptomyces]|uniref:DUF3376 domain-containing protein n=1 Tax=unclassified Streptomyces TaxID=2593676 RepID=UPI0004BDFCF2|nr:MULTISPECIES: DUF3376 domain-containing protein [unclassified Streptomyces]